MRTGTGIDDKGLESFGNRPGPAGAQPGKIATPSTPDASPRTVKERHKSSGSHGGFVNRARRVETTPDPSQR